MVNKKSLGLFFGSQSLSLVETDNQSPQRFFNIPLNSIDHSAEAKTPDEIRLTALIQKCLKDNKITTKEVSLSLPARDIIFRSFVIPFMNPNEVKGVVDFESRKYIPFKLSELIYTYHPIIIQDKGNKQIRILFAAIKHEVLENYCSLIEHAGLNIGTIEPGPVSLVRALTFKRLIPLDQTVVIIKSDGKDGKIIIIEQGILQFVRDFQMVQSSGQRMETDPDLLDNRLYNEIRISLDYYARQSGQDKIDRIIAIGGQTGSGLLKNLEKELGIPVTSTNTQSIFNQQGAQHSDLINAYGIGLRHSVAMNANFDLTRKISATPKTPVPEGKVPINFMSLAKVGVVCSILLVASFFLANGLVSGLKNRMAKLIEDQKEFTGINSDEIDQKTKANEEKLTEYKSVRLQSDMIFFLTLIPKFMPEGTWLKDMTIKYTEVPVKDQATGRPMENGRTETKLSIDLGGYAYAENSNQQIRLVRGLVAKFKENEKFAKSFTAIDLVTAQSLMMDEFPVTNYRIECK